MLLNLFLKGDLCHRLHSGVGLNLDEPNSAILNADYVRHAVDLKDVAFSVRASCLIVDANGGVLPEEPDFFVKPYKALTLNLRLSR